MFYAYVFSTYAYYYDDCSKRVGRFVFMTAVLDFVYSILKMTVDMFTQIIALFILV
jgi:hypothetical protein